MITDALVSFIPIGSNVAITNVPVRSNVYDFLGSGVGTAPHNIIGNRTLAGADLGIGGIRPQFEVLVGTAFAGGTSLNVAYQAAPDLGTPTYQPGAWQTIMETGAILTANLTAAQILARFDFMPNFPANLNPRYLSLLFTPVGVFTGGTISSAPVTMVRDDQANKFASNNFSVR